MEILQHYCCVWLFFSNPWDARKGFVFLWYMFQNEGFLLELSSLFTLCSAGAVLLGPDWYLSPPHYLHSCSGGDDRGGGERRQRYGSGREGSGIKWDCTNLRLWYQHYFQFIHWIKTFFTVYNSSSQRVWLLWMVLGKLFFPYTEISETVTFYAAFSSITSLSSPSSQGFYCKSVYYLTTRPHWHSIWLQ